MHEQLALSRKDVAAALGVSLRTVDNLLARGELCGARRIGRRIVIPKLALEQFLKRDHSTGQGKSDGR